MDVILDFHEFILFTHLGPASIKILTSSLVEILYL